MALFTPGAGGTLKSTIWEGALLEGALTLQNVEALTVNEPTPLDNMNVSIDTSDGTASITYNAPLTVSVNPSGQIVFTGFDYSDTSFAPGDLNSTNLPAAVLEMFQQISTLEADQNLDNVQVTYDAELLIATCTATIPVTLSVNPTDGSLKVDAAEYISTGI
jgi:hypothetical protein